MYLVTADIQLVMVAGDYGCYKLKLIVVFLSLLVSTTVISVFNKPISPHPALAITRLPSDLQRHIISYFRVTDTLNLGRASRALRSIVTAARLFDFEIRLSRDHVSVRSHSLRTFKRYPSFRNLTEDLIAYKGCLQNLEITTTVGFFDAAQFAQLVELVYRIAPNSMSLVYTLDGMDQLVLKELRTANLVPPLNIRYTVKLKGPLNRKTFPVLHELLPLKRLWPNGKLGQPTLADLDEIEKRIWPQIHARVCIHDLIGHLFLACPESGPLKGPPFVYSKALERLTLDVRSLRNFQILQKLLPNCDNLRYLHVSFSDIWVIRNGELLLPNSVKELAVYDNMRRRREVVVCCYGELDRMYLNLLQFHDKMKFKILSIGTLHLRYCSWKVQEEIESLTTLRAQNVEMDTQDAELLGIFKPAAHSVMR